MRRGGRQPIPRNVLALAYELRQEGITWQVIAKHLRHSYASLRAGLILAGAKDTSAGEQENPG